VLRISPLSTPQILSNVERVQERTGKILQEQERDLLRAFRARLFDVQTELEKEKNKTDDGASAWIEKSRQLEAEVDWAKEMADRLDRVNQSMGRENARLKAQFKTQEDDREFLIRQLVAVKKDNARFLNGGGRQRESKLSFFTPFFPLSPRKGLCKSTKKLDHNCKRSSFLNINVNGLSYW
jgi:hypothetical protein